MPRKRQQNNGQYEYRPQGSSNTTIIAGGNQGSMKIGPKGAGNSTIMDRENQGSTHIGPKGADIMTITAGGNPRYYEREQQSVRYERP